jgi:formate dehydrogenase major subunit
MYHLGRRVREKLAGSSAARDRAVLELTWDYPTEGAFDDPDAEAVLREIGGVDLKTAGGSRLPAAKDDGSTACGCWIYAAAMPAASTRCARRKPRLASSRRCPRWGWAWPMNRRILYNRASPTRRQPWSERKRYVWWDAEQGKWAGEGRPGLQGRHGARLRPPRAPGPRGLRGDEPFHMQADGKAWL